MPRRHTCNVRCEPEDGIHWEVGFLHYSDADWNLIGQTLYDKDTHEPTDVILEVEPVYEPVPMDEIVHDAITKRGGNPREYTRQVLAKMRSLDIDNSSQS